MTQKELTIMQDMMQYTYNRMGDENITDLQYKSYRSQLAGMRKILKAIGYIVETDYMNKITIEKAVTK